jgi:hypothetical protein
MDIVSQILGALKIGAKAAFTVFFACALCLAAAYYRSDLFEGIPPWVIPSILMGAIFSFALWFVPLSIWTGTKALAIIRAQYALWTAPGRKKRIEALITSAPPVIKYVLLYAIARQTQNMRAPPSALSTIRMMELGLIEQRGWRGSEDFRIPDEVWLVALSIEGFYPVHSGSMYAPWTADMPEERVLAHIPAEFRN